MASQEVSVMVYVMLGAAAAWVAGAAVLWSLCRIAADTDRREWERRNR
jgi:hypothetical protein